MKTMWWLLTLAPAVLGVGLALVRAIAIRHYGRVSLRSRLIQGTVIGRRLPAG